MNKLEQKIAIACGFKKIASERYSNSDLNTIKIAASIALKLAETAYGAGRSHEFDACTNMDTRSFEDFEKEIL